VQPRLQRDLGHHYYVTVRRALCATDKLLHARVVSCTSRAASRWLTSAPRSYGRALSDEHCRLAIRQRIGAPLFDDLPQRCACGTATNTPEQYGHMHWCEKLRAPATTVRHNHVVDALTKLARAAGVTAQVELVQPTWDAVLSRWRNLQPDITLLGASGVLLSDVTVVHPTAVAPRTRSSDAGLRQR